MELSGIRVSVVVFEYFTLEGEAIRGSVWNTSTDMMIVFLGWLMVGVDCLVGSKCKSVTSLWTGVENWFSSKTEY